MNTQNQDIKITCSPAVAAVRPVIAGMENAVVTVCAWCDRDKAQTNALTALGYTVSHGICPKHAETFAQPADEDIGQAVKLECLAGA